MGGAPSHKESKAAPPHVIEMNHTFSHQPPLIGLDIGLAEPLA
jgi:hypothetical protein